MDLRRQQTAIDVRHRGLAVAGLAAIVAVHAQVDALARLDQRARHQAAAARHRQIVTRQQTEHTHDADHGIRRQDDIARRRGLAGFVARHQPCVTRLDAADVHGQRLRHALRVIRRAHLHQRHIAARQGVDRSLRPHRRHDQGVVDLPAGGVGLRIAAYRAARREVQAAARHDRVRPAAGSSRMRRLVVDDAGLAGQMHLVACARLHPRQRQVMDAQLAERYRALGRGHQMAGHVRQQRRAQLAYRAGQGFQPHIARRDGGLAGRRAVQDRIQRVDACIPADPVGIDHIDAAQAQTVHAVQIDALGRRGAHHSLRVALRDADQQRRALLRQVRAQLAHGLARDQDHLPRVAQCGKVRRAQIRQHHVRILPLPCGRGVQDRLPRLQRHAAGRHHLADQQIGVRLVGRAACRRALGVSQDQVQVLRAQLRHARHAAGLHVQGMAGAQVQLQVLAAIVLIDAVGVARAAHDVLVGHQADLADALQRAGVGADDGAALRADRDGDAFLGMDVAQADAALRRVQAHRGVAIRGDHAVYGLHRERARQFQRQIARVTHVAHQHAGAQRLRAGAILRHVWHADLAPYRIQETAADIHHLHAVGARGIDIGLQLAALAGRCAFQHLAVVDEDVTAVLVQVETVGKQELDGAVGRQRPAQHQRRIVGEQRLEALPQRRVGEIDAGAVQRHGAGRADVAVKRVIDARQIDRVGARQDGLVGLRQRVEHVGAVGLRQPAQAGQLQGVVAEFGADRALARGAQHDVRTRLHVQEAVGGRCALAAAFQVEDLFVDGRRHRIQQVVLDIAQRRRREIEEMARIIGLAVQGDLLRGLRGRVGTHRIDARIRLYPRPVQAGRVERQRDGLAQVRVQRQQAVVLPGAGLVEHGVGQRCRQPDRAVRADDGVIGRVGPHVAHGMPEIDLVARAQGTQLPGAVIDDIHVGQLETAIRHGDQSGDCRPKGGFQPIAPVVVVLGRLRQFLVDHIVVDDLIARRLDQVLGRCDVQRGRQVVGIEALVAQLFMQRLQLGAQPLGGTRRLRLEQMRGNGEHAAHVRRRKAAQQFTRDAGIREQRLGQRPPFGRLVQRLDLLIQHRLFL